MRLVITGTPATGKSTLAAQIAERNGWTLFSITEFVKEKRLGKKTAGGELEVEPAALRKALTPALKKAKDFVLEGHLACEFAVPADAVVVLRCDPMELRKRYAGRGYAPAKAKENLLAEALDYCLVKAEAAYGREKVVQLDATRKRTEKEVTDAALKRRSERVDWSRYMLPGKRLAFLLSDA